MNSIEFKPAKANGIINVPSSKSFAHRFLICSALANGTSKLENVDMSDDVKSTLNSLQNIGYKYTFADSNIVGTGIDIFNTSIINPLDCNESGSTLRFLIPFCLLTNKEIKFIGKESLFKRPLNEYAKLCQNNGFIFDSSSTSLLIKGQLKAGKYTINGDISSQFISGLLFALPLLKQDSEIEINNIESKPYIDLTIFVLDLFKIKINWKNENTLSIPGSQKYIPCSYSCESDYTLSAYLDIFNYIGGKVILNKQNESHQGDSLYIKFYNEILSGITTISIKDTPDLAPILMTLSSFHNGIILTDTKRLQYKESNRGIFMANELSKFGANIEVVDNNIIVKKAKLHAPKLPIDTHNDHRIAMATSPLLSYFGGIINNPNVVSKSYPNYFKVLKEINLILNEV